MSQSIPNKEPQRWRNLLIVVGLLVIAVGVFYLLTGRPQSNESTKELVIASYGGAWQEAQRHAMFKPFEVARSIKITDVVYDGQYAKIREMVRVGRVEWDVVDVEGNMVVLGAKEKVLEAIDYSVVPRTDLMQDAVHDYGTGIVAWSWVLAYRKGGFDERHNDNPWRAFFDPSLVPGPRGMRNDPRRTLEVALLADGVAPDKLYPLDLGRAFSVLDKFRSAMKKAGHAIVWWDAYAQPPQLLRDGEVVLTPAANGRIADAQKQGAAIDFTWQHGIVDWDWWIVPKGTKNRAEAMSFLSFASSPSVQAAIAREIPYGPVNTKALAQLPEDIQRNLPTYPSNLKKQLVFNTQWWADNYDRVQERWNQWRAGGQ